MEVPTYYLGGFVDLPVVPIRMEWNGIEAVSQDQKNEKEPPRLEN